MTRKRGCVKRLVLSLLRRAVIALTASMFREAMAFIRGISSTAQHIVLRIVSLFPLAIAFNIIRELSLDSKLLLVLMFLQLYIFATLTSLTLPYYLITVSSALSLGLLFFKEIYRAQDKLFVSTEEIADGNNETSAAILRETQNQDATYTEMDVDGEEKLYPSTEEIAKESNETVDFEGAYRDRKNLYLQAIAKRPSKYTFLVVEHCICSLSDLIKLHTDALPASDDLHHHPVINKQNIKLWDDETGYASPLLLNLIRDMAYELHCVQERGIIHQDITPQNVRIVQGRDVCAKLSDIDISNCLPSDMSSQGQKYDTGSCSSGRQAPEQTQARDMFSLGLVFLFCLSRGVHPSVKEDIKTIYKRVSSYLAKKRPEAINLASLLLDSDPKRRPKAFQVKYHPLFWDSVRRLAFLCVVSDWVEAQNPSLEFLRVMEKVGRKVFEEGQWDNEIEEKLLRQLKLYRNYDGTKLKDLLRAVRNTNRHHLTFPGDIKQLVGSTREGIDKYFHGKFRRLF